MSQIGLTILIFPFFHLKIQVSKKAPDVNGSLVSLRVGFFVLYFLIHYVCPRNISTSRVGAIVCSPNVDTLLSNCVQFYLVFVLIIS